MKEHLRRALMTLVTIGITTVASAQLFPSPQIDLSGNWQPDIFLDYTDAFTGAFPDDYAGIPINDQARRAAQSFSAESTSELQRQCEPWLVHYLMDGPFGFRLWPTNDPLSGAVTAWHMSAWIDRMPMTIVMDGSSPPPPLALHTYSGYSTGVWHGHTLITTTTHIKDGFLRRNGIPSSNQELYRMFMTRHGDALTITSIVRDPVYLTGPYPLARSYTIDPTGSDAVIPMHCAPEQESASVANGYQNATLLPGTSTLLTYMKDHYNIPFSAAMGGSETMYPEYQKQLKGKYTIPARRCTQYCCGSITGGFGPNSFEHKTLKCHADL